MPTGRRGQWVVEAVDGLRVVGFAWARAAAGDDAGAYIEEVAVVEDRRRHGLAGCLVLAVGNLAAEAGRPSLTVHPVSDSHGWVTRLGFQPVNGPDLRVPVREPPPRAAVVVSRERTGLISGP